MLGTAAVAAGAAAVVPGVLALNALSPGGSEPKAEAMPFLLSAPPSLTVRADALYPEGVAWDPTRQAFLVSSTGRGTISIVGADGGLTPFITEPDPRVVSTVGMQVDLARLRLLVAYHDFGFGARTKPETALKSAGLLVYDLVSGRQLALVDLAIGAGPVWAADRIALDRSGTAYVCDPAAGAIYRVTPDYQASVVVQHPLLAASAHGAGVVGIAFDEAQGVVLGMNYSAGTLARVPVADPAATSQVRVDRMLPGSDGITMTPDGHLLVVSNHLAAHDGSEAVTELATTDGWLSARTVARHEPWPIPSPTDLTVTPYGTYVLSGRVDSLFGGGPGATDFVLHRI
ncbi:sugar lactone lactonase YvrE [Nocardia tenerifensis]|uniref:Sugar lactone lactonase YvrE n=2 Tax=Nocardia tenerifensis TaxID=228006 RepID=A0A318KP89_9NOCA|nr:sugar lactone lactonase YvrE [Nocardia tenerifensis]